MAKLSTKKVTDEQGNDVTADFGGETNENVNPESAENNEGAGDSAETGAKDEQPKDSAVKVRSNLVQVRLNRNHKCTIGGTRYVFVKGNRYNVPEDVKRVLSVSGLLTNL